MNMKIISKWMGVILLASSALFTTNVMAQDLKKPTLEDLIPGGETYRFAKSLYRLQWWGDTCIKPEIDSLFAVNPKTGKETLLLTRERINQVLEQEKLGKLSHLYQVSLPWAEKTQLLITLPGNYIVYDWKADKIISKQALPEKAANEDYNTVSDHIAYTLNNNLYVNDRAVTNEPEGIVCGQSVHRNEFGITKGTFWSPDGKQLAFYRMDQSMVPDYPQVDITTRIATTYPCKYPMAGEKMHKVTVGVFTPATGRTVWLQAGDPTDRYFTNISWSPDNRKIYMIELNRDQNHAELVCYDTTTGKKEGVIYEEEHPKYVEPMHGLLFLPWDSSKFIYQSQRDGYNHLYLFDLSKPQAPQRHKTLQGGACEEHVEVTPLTSGEWVVKEVLGFDLKEKSLLFCSNEIHPLQSNIYKVCVKDGKRTLLDNGEGVHYGSVNADGTYVEDRYSSPTVARSISLTDTRNGKGRNLLTAKDPWKDYNVPEITCGSIKAADGTTDLYYRMVKPVDFDPNKKYPTVIYVYGGPHAHNVEASRNYLARGWEIYMAQKGYLLFILDNRGSEHRGLAFENVTFRHLGVEEMKDQMEGVRFLKSLPYVDADRMGVHGWSFGGFMTTNLMLTYPDVFKAGVAGGPVVDWQYYEVMYGERYMDRPQDNPEGYKGSNLRLKAGNLKGKLQVIIGYNDPVCVPQHSLSFLRACIDAGTQPDFFTYPGDEHNMMGKDRVHLHERITQYFEDYLK